MLDDDLKTQLKAYLEKLTRPVELVAALDEGEASREMRGFLEDIVALSDQVSLTTGHGTDVRVPSFSVSRPGQDLGIRFAGIPSGHEFTSLVLALLHVGGHPPKAGTELIGQIAALEGEHLFETYISLSCQNCPDVVQALNLMALVNPGIRHVTIDGALFQDEIAEREVMSVPSVFRNGEPFEQGRMTIEQILARLDTKAAGREVQKLDAREPYDVLVVGGGPAGAAAAVYAARKGIRTGLVAERVGGQLLDTLGIENFISVQATEGPKLAAQLEQHVRQYDVDLMQPHRAQSLAREGEHAVVRLANGASLRARSVVLATGARWKQINVPGEAEYRNKGVAYCPHCDGPLFRGKRVAVIGGGNSGVEAAIDLAGLVRHVTLIEFDARLRADDVLQRKLASLDNVTVVTSGQTTEVLGDGQKVTGLVYTERVGGETRRIELEGVFVQIGLLPNTEWLKDSLALSERGEIEVDAHGATSLPGVFAGGDATTTPYKQIVVAMGEGSRAALSAFDYLIRVPVVSPVDRQQTQAA